METKGIELPANSASKGQLDETLSQNPAHAGTNDPDLAWLTEHWLGLPESTRKQIIETARAALKKGETTP